MQGLGRSPKVLKKKEEFDMVKTKTKKNVSIIPGKMEHGKKADAEQKILRVAAYCRVSTQLEQQESSFEAQKNYYTEI